jgi:hypothetical protein
MVSVRTSRIRVEAMVVKFGTVLRSQDNNPRNKRGRGDTFFSLLRKMEK